MSTSFFSPEAEMALMGHHEELAQYFPSSTSQSPPNVMYSPSPQQMSHRIASSQHLPSTSYQPHGSPLVNSSYLPYTYWGSRAPAASPSYATYSNYPPSTEPLSSTSFPLDTKPVIQHLGGTRPSRSHSAASSNGMGMASAVRIERASPAFSRSLSPSSPDLRGYGHPNKNGTWSCAYPGCTSRAVFTRGCDLRKHHKRHTKSFFCCHEGCPQSIGGGFSSKKDLARHEAKHNPGVLCDWEGCDRVFSRVDNMRDHVKRIHLKTSRSGSASREQ